MGQVLQFAIYDLSFCSGCTSAEKNFLYSLCSKILRSTQALTEAVAIQGQMIQGIVRQMQCQQDPSDGDIKALLDLPLQTTAQVDETEECLRDKASKQRLVNIKWIIDNLNFDILVIIK